MIALLIFAEAAAMPMPAFISGCWEQRTEAGQWTEECWTDTRGGVMIGSGRAGKATASSIGNGCGSSVEPMAA